MVNSTSFLPFFFRQVDFVTFFLVILSKVETRKEVMFRGVEYIQLETFLKMSCFAKHEAQLHPQKESVGCSLLSCAAIGGQLRLLFLDKPDKTNETVIRIVIHTIRYSDHKSVLDLVLVRETFHRNC
jgi:hypothetical protein